MNTIDNCSRFTGRAENYARFRPGYPDAVIDVLKDAAGWSPDTAVADIGAGTGISSELFLRHGNRVWAVEPNADMRAAAETLRRTYPNFEIVDGSAETTGLPDACAGLVVAGTAFHWFDAVRCRSEFLRILNPGGQTVLMWNKRRSETSPFLHDYEDLLRRYGTDYKERWGTERNEIIGRIAAFFGAGFGTAEISNPQSLDREGLAGRLLSSSYAPLPGHPSYEPMVAALDELFVRYQSGGLVTIDYTTLVYWGRPAA